MKLYISTVFNSIDSITKQEATRSGLDVKSLAWKVSMTHYVGYTDQDVTKDAPNYELHVPSGLYWMIRDDDFTSGINGIVCENINQRSYDKLINQSGLPDEIYLIKFEDVIFDHLLKSNIIPDLSASEITQIIEPQTITDQQIDNTEQQASP